MSTRAKIRFIECSTLDWLVLGHSKLLVDGKTTDIIRTFNRILTSSVDRRRFHPGV